MKKFKINDLNNYRTIYKVSTEDFNYSVELQNELKKEHRKNVIFYGYCILTVLFAIFLFPSSRLLALFFPITAVVFAIIRSRRLPLTIDIYFGLPGAGKTTIAAAMAKKFIKKGFDVYSNVEILGTKKLDKSDLGFYQVENALIIIDEASIDFNNRKFNELAIETIRFLKLHRHYKTKILVFSQSYNDMDITLRRLAYNFYFVRKSIIPGVINCMPIRRSIGINDMTKEICDEYKIDPFFIRIFTTRRFVGRKYWKMFDSYEAPQLKEKKWPIWGKDDEQPTATEDISWFA